MAFKSLQHAARLHGAQPKASTERCNAHQSKGGAAATSGARLKSEQVDMGGRGEGIIDLGRSCGRWGRPTRAAAAEAGGFKWCGGARGHGEGRRYGGSH